MDSSATTVDSDVEAPALMCRGLRLAVGDRVLLDDIDLQIPPGRSVAVMGPSGSGKTTLLNCIAGIHPAAGGSVQVKGTDLNGLGAAGRARLRLDRIGMVFQFGELIPELTVGENVELPLRLMGRRDHEPAHAALASVGLGERFDSTPAELSGGEVQRAAIARALVKDPALVLADEPTGSLDEDLSAVVCELLLHTARARGAGVLVATHDPLVAARVDEVYVIRQRALHPR